MRTIQMVDPKGMEPQDWCDIMVLELDALGTIPIMNMGMTWKEWGNQVIQLYEISIKDPPDPDDYDEFEEWALDFNDSVFAED